MYTVLTGAKINVGDFLITERCKQLLKAFKPDRELHQLPHWEPLDTHLDKVNQSNAIIIMGGPGFQFGFYPNVYKLTSNLDRIIPPVIPMGLGWKGFPGDEKTVENYKFSKHSNRALQKFASSTPFFSCRDYQTQEILIRNGIVNVLMTGCPVWYDLDSIGKPFIAPKSIEKVVFSPAQRSMLGEQSTQVPALLRNLFPHARLFCSFNRGIYSDNPFVSKRDEQNNIKIRDAALKLGYEIVDASFQLDKIRFYDDCDLHVGYRVHSHLYFLSKRKPSVLLHEDGRGKGVSDAVNIVGIDAWKRGAMLGYAVIANPYTVSRLQYLLQAEMDNAFARYSGLGNVLDAHFQVMKKFIQSLP